MDRTDLSAHHRCSIFSIRFKHLQANPRTHSIIVARRIPAAVQVKAYGRGALLKGQTELGLSYDNQGDGAINAGASSGLDARESGCCAHFLPSELLDTKQ